MGYLPAHRLDRQTEEIRNFRARQRNVEGDGARNMLVTLGVKIGGQQTQEGRQLLTCVLAPECEHPVPCFIKFAQCLIEQLLLQFGRLLHELIQHRARKRANPHIRRRFDGDAALKRKRPAQKVWRKLQTDDLLAAIGRQLAEFDYAAQDCRITLNFLALTLDFLLTRVNLL